MKFAVAVVALLAALAAASTKEADEVSLKKQQDVLRLLYKIHQKFVNPELTETAKSFDIEKNVDHYRDAQVVHRFLDFYKHGRFLERDQQLLPHCKKHMYQFRLVFDLLFFANDYDTFYKTAVWVREHLNQGMFYYAFTVAVLNREDTKNVVLPPVYEIWPELFVHSDVIQKAYDAYGRGLTYDKEHPYVVYANYTGYPVAHHPEELVSYFREDVGLSAYFSSIFYKSPSFLNRVNYTGIPEDKFRGLRFYSYVEHLLTRYNMERLSNRLPFVKPVEFFNPIDVGYYPELRLHSGVEAPFRPEGLNMGDKWNLKKDYLLSLEWRIRDSIDYGFVMDRQHEKVDLIEKKAVQILGNIIEGNGDSLNSKFYGHFMRDLIVAFGRSVDEDNHYSAAPSVLEFIETATRDPLYFRILARVDTMFKQYFKQLPPYTKHDLEHPEFKITDLTVDKIVTYFDDFDFSIANTISIKSMEEKDKVNVVARTHRLNHKPFNYKMTINSEKDDNVVVRVFYGPRFDYLGREMSFEEQRKRFHMFDIFDMKLHAGENKIERSTKDMSIYSDTAASGRDLWSRTQQALKGEKPFVAEEFLRLQRFPQRLAVPKGTREGMPLRFFVFVHPATEAVENSPFMSFTDNELINYPLERRVFEFDLDVPNARFADTVVFHKTENDTA
uniref:Hexamerin-like protein 2 n=1 Tax=Tetrix subulata TaxID=288127 RepID=A0A2I6SDC7_9ORTH|nr:hexamerin-like protein 2 [Tetrix subulata]